MSATGRPARAAEAPVHGVLLADKPRGLTSHDVVKLVRKAVRTRAVGHAGTLDPMATGLLVCALGEGCKLLRWLGASDKRYRATLVLGRETDSLDADGKVVGEAPVPVLTPAGVEAATVRFLGRTRQQVPAVSAVKIGGVPLYARAQRGEAVSLPEREVVMHRIEVLDVRASEIDVELDCAAGFYVRALGRDLARALGTVGHLTALRRLASGALSVEGALDAASLVEAASGDESARERVLASIVPVEAALPAVPRFVVDDAGRTDARHGRPVRRERVVEGDWPSEGREPSEPVLVLGADGRAVALARAEPDALHVVRGLFPAEWVP